MTFRDVILWLAEQDELRNQTLVFVLGSMLTLIMSCVKQEYRSSLRLFAGSILGGIGGVLSYRIYSGIYWEGVVILSALGAEKLALTWIRITEDLSKNPFLWLKKWLGFIVAVATALRTIKLPEEDISERNNEDQSSEEEYSEDDMNSPRPSG